MGNRFVIDTTSLISFFPEVFNKTPQISDNALKIIGSAFIEEDIILIIPSIVFVEIFRKWYRNEELAQKIRYDVYERIRSRPNIEIRPTDSELLENFLKITDIEPQHKFDNHDKQILACAIMLNCSLITSDRRIIRYNRRKSVLKEILS